jgi:hypothetical protein
VSLPGLTNFNWNNISGIIKNRRRKTLRKKKVSDINRSEEDMALLAKPATRAAYRKAIRNGNTVLISDNGGIFKTLPSGEREFVKRSGRLKK